MFILLSIPMLKYLSLRVYVWNGEFFYMGSHLSTAYPATMSCTQKQNVGSLLQGFSSFFVNPLMVRMDKICNPGIYSDSS